jgi:hypothetical protein
MMTFRPFSPRCRPFASSSTTAGLLTVRTNGTMTCTLVRPISSRTIFSASALQLEAGPEGLVDVARGAAEPEHRVLLVRLVLPPPIRLAYSFDLKSDRRTITGSGAKAAAMVAMPSASARRRTPPGSRSRAICVDLSLSRRP